MHPDGLVSGRHRTGCEARRAVRGEREGEWVAKHGLEGHSQDRGERGFWLQLARLFRHDFARSPANGTTTRRTNRDGACEQPADGIYQRPRASAAESTAAPG